MLQIIKRQIHSYIHPTFSRGYGMIRKADIGLEKLHQWVGEATWTWNR